MAIDAQVWLDALAECSTVELFNQLAVATARDQRKSNPDFARFVVAEARRRRYTWLGDRDSGWYVDVTPEEHEAVLARLQTINGREQKERMRKMLRKTKVELVSASWEVWVYGHGIDLGAMMIFDCRKRVNNQVIYEFDQVPQDLFYRLFTKEAKVTLANIYKMFGHQIEAQQRNWREAI